MIKQIKTLDALQLWRKEVPSQSKTVSFVPTMGALHEGHLSLVKEGFKHADNVIVSIFVNPTQFAPHEDFDSYPRTIEDDIQKLEELGVHAVWLPNTEDIYPNGVQSDIYIEGLSEPLDGEFRPHFFGGVATVVARLFNIIKPEIALFGEKDFQQLQIIKKMVEDFNIPTKIIGVPIARDENGLALSSRNAYLNDEEYKIAIKLNKVLKEMACHKLDETTAVKKLIEIGFDDIDYCTLRNSKTLGVESPDRAFAAVWLNKGLGKTRLIDNMQMK